MAAKRKKAKETAVSPVRQSVNVDLDRAKNGYIVSTWTDKGSLKYIAKTKKEAMAYANRLLSRR